MIPLTITENILFFVSGFGIVQGILLAAIICFHPKSKHQANKFLALYIFFLSLVMTLPFIVKVIPWQNSFFHLPIPLLAGPLLYLYLRSYKEKITWKKALPHFMLFFVFFFPSYLNVAALAEKYPDSKQLPAEALQDTFAVILSYVRLGQSVFYFFLARKVALSYQPVVKKGQVKNSRMDFQWAKVLVHGYIFLVFTGILIFTLMLRYPQHFTLLLLINMAIATPYIYIATYKGVLKPAIWQLNSPVDIIPSEKNNQSVIEEKPRLQRVMISNDKIDETISRIIALMEKEKLYQETELTLQDLADRLELPAYQVSQAINEGMQKNFYDLINSYRVKEAKRLLVHSNNMNYTILSLGFEAGFNSKTTFNTVFKKFTGLTPTEYREKQLLLTV